jgi:hypothetical protein
MAISVGGLMTAVGLALTGVRRGDMNPRFHYGQMNEVHLFVEVSPR